MSFKLPIIAASALVLAACGVQQDSAEIDDSLVEATLGSALEGFEASGEEGDNAPEPGVEGGNGINNAFRCLTTTTDPSPLTLPLPDQFGITFEFDQCRIRWGRWQSGVHTIDVARSPDWLTRDFTSARDVTHDLFFGGKVEIDAQGTLHAEGSRAGGAISRLLNHSQHRVRTLPAGETLYDVNIELNDLGAEDTYNATRRLSKRVINGEGKLTKNRLGSEITATLAGVTIEPAVCCHPSAGTVTFQRVGPFGGEQSVEWTFDNQVCGQANSDDGRTINMVSCDLL